MRRTPSFFACAGIELARYFVLAYAAAPFAAVSPSAPQVLRFIAAPNALFAVAFLFLGLDSVKYSVYGPLLIVGKAVALFSAAMALPRLLIGAHGSSAPYAFLGIALWDAASMAFILIKRRRLSPAQAIRDPEPESVELD